MTMLEWDKSGEKIYETGVDRGVLYPASGSTYPAGYAWNGLTAVTESPSGAESNPQYADNGKYLDLRSAEEFGATIEAFTYPDEFADCDGTRELIAGVRVGQQDRKPFGLSYRTKIGNDVDGQDHGYKIHLVYGATASPSEKNYSTVNDSPEAITFSWEVTTVPVNVATQTLAGGEVKPCATLTIDSTKFEPEVIKKLTDVLWGASEGSARLPLPDEVVTLLSSRG